MKKISPLQSTICVISGVMMLFSGCAPQETADVEDVTAAVSDIWGRYSSSLNSGDLDGWLSLWTEDGVQMPPGEAPVIGKDKIRARNGPFLDQFTFEMAITNEEVGVAWRLGVRSGHVHGNFDSQGRRRGNLCRRKIHDHFAKTA